MKNLKKITRNELKSITGGGAHDGIIFGGGNGLPKCGPLDMEMWEAVCDPSINPSDDCRPKCRMV